MALTSAEAGKPEPRDANLIYLAASGCPEAVGEEYSLTAAGFGGSAGTTVRSRTATFFLGDSATLAYELEAGLAQELWFFLLGTLFRNPDALSGKGMASLLSGIQYGTAGQGVWVRVPGDTIVNHTTVWTANFSYGPEGLGYPTGVRWAREKDGRTMDSGSMSIRGLVARPTGTLQFSCQADTPQSSPPGTPRLLGPDDLPPPHEIPSQYPWRRAYQEFLEVPETKEFQSKYPDARVLGMESSDVYAMLSNPVGGPRLYYWDFTLASPSQAIKREIRMSQSAWYPTNVTTSPSEYRAGDEGPLLNGMSAVPSTQAMPLIPFDEALALAAKAGVPHPTRAGWGEPPFQGYHAPFWYVGYQHPQYGQEPGATRTYLFFDAGTGFLRSAFRNIPGSDFGQLEGFAPKGIGPPAPNVPTPARAFPAIEVQPP